MGDFEICISYFSVFILGVIIYKIINIIFNRDLIRRFGLYKETRKDFYECGFRPITQKPLRMPIQFLIICIFFILYDMELIFLFPWFMSSATSVGFFDFILILFFFFILFLSLILDYDRQALLWQY